MMFAERLNALVKISGATNAMIGRALGMDSSHIGRLRNGTRKLPKVHDFLMPLCEYLVRRYSKDYQLTALYNLTGITGKLFSEQELAQRLAGWLTENCNDEIAAASQFISSFSRMTKTNVDAPVPKIHTSRYSTETRTSYFGDEGKRRAVERFFLEILKEDQPQTLLLFSDESFSWLYENADFAMRWRELFTAVLYKGNRVKIAHTVSRSIGEMLEGVSKWLPVYMTGAVEPYYYPRPRDGLFQRTMFIAPHTAAILSSSVRQDSSGMLNLYLREQKDVMALTRECENFFAVCKPLARTYDMSQAGAFFHNAVNLMAAKGDALYYSMMPPLAAMPEQMVKDLSLRSKLPNFFDLWKKT